MNLSDLICKIEIFLAGLEKDELYLLRGMVIEDKGVEILMDKIDRKICYLENRSHSTHQEFNKIISGAYREKTA